MKTLEVGFLKILWETDKVHFTSSNLVCVYTHHKFQNMKFSLSVFDKILKIPIQNVFFSSISISLFREAKFKRALRVHFLTPFTKNFCRFLTPKVKSSTDMINPSIESSDFLFWHEKIFSWIFENFVENRQTKFHILKFMVCVNTH